MGVHFRATAADDSWVRSLSRRALSAHSLLAIAGAAVVLVWLGASVADGTLSPLSTVTAVAAVVTSLALTVASLHDTGRFSRSRTEARTDDLTGLGNRRALIEHLDAALGVDSPAPFALLLVELDRFDEVNDALGHRTGDEILRLIRPRFEANLREGDLACRLGGDEFAVVIEGDLPEERAWQVAQRIRTALMAPFTLGTIDVFIEASIGICSAPLHAQTSEHLLRLADVAMYDARRERLGVSTYRPGLEVINTERLALAHDLRQALHGDEIQVHFQPKVDLAEDRVVGAEALVRWVHPVRGMVSPDEFVPVAEDTGQAAMVTSLVLDRALEQVARWSWDELDLRVSVNLYESDLRTHTIVERVAAALARHHVAPSALQVEVTEQTLMAEPERTREVLEAIHALGVRVSLDDYGTGYSSLAYLREFPIDELKMDKAFALGLDDRTTSIIVRSTIELAHALGMRIIAEGIQDDATRLALMGMGCDEGQGHLWSPALPADDFSNWMASRHS